MPPVDEKPRFPVGKSVRVRNSGYKKARIVELRGPLGPNRAQVYRLRVRTKPRPQYIEVLEEQLEELSPEE